MQLTVTQYHQLTRLLRPAVSPQADCSKEQDLCDQVLDYIAGSMQQVDTDKEFAPPDLDQEAEVMAFLMQQPQQQKDANTSHYFQNYAQYQVW